MTSSGKIRIYELSRDLNLDNKDVLNAAKKLSISVKSHSSSISDEDASKIKQLISGTKNIHSPAKPKSNNKEILSLKKAAEATVQKNKANNIRDNNHKQNKSEQKKIPSISPSKQKIAKSPTPPSSLKKDNKTTNKIVSPIQPKQPAKPLSNQPKNINPSQIQPKQPARPTSPISQKNSINPPIAREAVSEDKKTNIISKPSKPQQQQKPLPQTTNKSSNLFNKPSKPLTQKPSNTIGQKTSTPNKPLAAPPRPRPRPQVTNYRPAQAEKSNNNSSLNSRRPLGERKNNIQSKTQRKSNETPFKENKNKVELVGAPIRRNNNKQSNTGRRGPKDRDNRQPGGNPYSPQFKQGSGRRSDSDRSQQMRPRPGGMPPGRPGMPPGRPGMPPGMRRPVAPGELMQLQKPTNKATPPTRRNESAKGVKREGVPSAKPPTNRPTPSAAPKRPPQRANAQGSARKKRPDWDDAAKLEALRNKSPQKQRQKVHIIGENDDALTTETSGFAGGQQATLLSASLARPASPTKAKSKQKTSSKPTGAIRKRKKESTRQRQRRRAMELRAAREAKQVRPEMIIVPEDNITVQELADKLSVESSEIIKSLFFKGITATVTQSLDLQTIETVAEEFGVPVLQDDAEEAAKKTVEMIEEGDIQHLIRRPPVVTVMGHVDHGKTSLLDAIRKARVAAGEAGGITQHIGAYQVEVKHDNNIRKLTFLDTPGHEAFTAMRARGTKVTDVAVLVVAADDGVRPQTLEAISHARAAKVPIVVAINKIDKEGASPDRVKQELSEQELVAEDWGGDVVMMPVSAIKGENIDKLLEMILLVTEVEDLQANPDRLAKGTVVEAHLDKAKGPVATLLVQNGTLKSGDVVAAGAVLGKIRAMVDENGKRLKEAGPSCPVEALGFNEVPTAGDEFEVYPDEKSARNVVGVKASDARATRLAQQMASRRVSLAAMSGQANEGELKELNLILKADVQGSVEAILGSLEQLPKDEVQVRVLLSAPGEITETDVDLAAASGAVIIGFNTSMASGAKRAADANSVDVREYEVIYKLLEDIQLAMEGLLEPDLVEEKTGEAEVRAIFSIGKSAVAGCYVTNGKLQRNCKVKVKRSGQIVFEGDLDSLRRNRDVVKEVANGFECGIGCDRFANWKEGDLIEGYKLVTQRRKLTT